MSYTFDKYIHEVYNEIGFNKDISHLKEKFQEIDFFEPFDHKYAFSMSYKGASPMAIMPEWWETVELPDNAKYLVEMMKDDSGNYLDEWNEKRHKVIGRILAEEIHKHNDAIITHFFTGDDARNYPKITDELQDAIYENSDYVKNIFYNMYGHYEGIFFRAFLNIMQDKKRAAMWMLDQGYNFNKAEVAAVSAKTLQRVIDMYGITSLKYSLSLYDLSDEQVKILLKAEPNYMFQGGYDFNKEPGKTLFAYPQKNYIFSWAVENGADVNLANPAQHYDISGYNKDLLDKTMSALNFLESHNYEEMQTVYQKKAACIALLEKRDIVEVFAELSGAEYVDFSVEVIEKIEKSGNKIEIDGNNLSYTSNNNKRLLPVLSEKAHVLLAPNLIIKNMNAFYLGYMEHFAKGEDAEAFKYSQKLKETREKLRDSWRRAHGVEQEILSEIEIEKTLKKHGIEINNTVVNHNIGGKSYLNYRAWQSDIDDIDMAILITDGKRNEDDFFRYLDGYYKFSEFSSIVRSIADEVRRTCWECGRKFSFWEIKTDDSLMAWEAFGQRIDHWDEAYCGCDNG